MIPELFDHLRHPFLHILHVLHPMIGLQQRRDLQALKGPQLQLRVYLHFERERRIPKKN